MTNKTNVSPFLRYGIGYTVRVKDVEEPCIIYRVTHKGYEAMTDCKEPRRIKGIMDADITEVLRFGQ